MIPLRPATMGDIPAIRALIDVSVRGLSLGFYSPRQIESALRFVFGPDTQLVADGTYFVAVADDQLAGCGGWSRRRTLFGGDQMKDVADPLLDPATDAARIRAFFVHPAFARRGLGSALIDRCLAEARAAGFSRVELMATLPGEPLYRSYGFGELERVESRLADGVVLPMVRMERSIESRLEDDVARLMVGMERSTRALPA